jgi:hypothetical protein
MVGRSPPAGFLRDPRHEIIEVARDLVHVVERWLLALISLKLVLPKPDRPDGVTFCSYTPQISGRVISDWDEALWDPASIAGDRP